MTAEQFDRCKKLANYVRTMVQPASLNIRTLWRSDVASPCGAAGCLIGHGAAIFPDMYVMELDGEQMRCVFDCGYVHYSRISAQVFGIPCHVTDNPFDPSAYMDTNGEYRNPTPQEAADKLEEVAMRLYAKEKLT